MMPILIGCCMCYCINRKKFCCLYTRSASPNIDTNELESSRQSSTSIHMPSQAEIEVIGKNFYFPHMRSDNPEIDATELDSSRQSNTSTHMPQQAKKEVIFVFDKKEIRNTV